MEDRRCKAELDLWKKRKKKKKKKSLVDNIKVNMNHESERNNFHLSFLNLDISVNIEGKGLEIAGRIAKIDLGGRVSQILNLRRSSYCMKSRKSR